MNIEEIKKVLRIIAPFEGLRVEKHNKIAKAKKAGVTDEQKKYLVENGYMKKSLNLTPKGKELI